MDLLLRQHARWAAGHGQNVIIPALPQATNHGLMKPVHEFRQELSGVVDNVPESIVVTAGEYSFHEHS